MQATVNESLSPMVEKRRSPTKVQDIPVENGVKLTNIIVSAALFVLMTGGYFLASFANHFMEEATAFKNEVVGGISDINTTLQTELPKLSTGVAVLKVRVDGLDKRVTTNEKYIRENKEND